MAEMDWARATPVARPESPLLAALRRLNGGFFDWEAVITLVLTVGAITAVTAPLEDNGWSKQMPPLTTVSLMSVVAAMLLARSRLSVFVAWPLGVVTGALVTFWQTLVLVGPGTLNQRLDAMYYRFETWFDLAFNGGVSNDSLPFNVLVIGITWLGVFLFGWSVFRWHNAWIGLIPGGIALFLDLVLVGDKLTGAIVLYMLFGSLLVMQTNLLSSIRRWRKEGTAYPPLLNLSFLNFSAWALIVLCSAAWIMPAGPFSTPRPVQTLIDRVIEEGANFVRLAGPLQSKKVIPIHSYSGVLPFQGSINLGDRELMAVTITDPKLQGPLLLRGSVYDEYEGGGWTTGEREGVELPPGTEQVLRAQQNAGALDGQIVPLLVEMQAKSVVGTVVFTAGQPVSVSRNLEAQVPESAIVRKFPELSGGGRSLSDTEVLAEAVAPGEVGLDVVRNADNTVQYVRVVMLNDLGLIEGATVLDPGGRIKRHQSYSVTGYIPNVTEEELRAAGYDYPNWVTSQYLQLPETLPESVPARARELAATAAENPYDQAKAIENELRTNYSMDYNVPETPPGRDTVEYFLFDLHRGYFDYHASAMVVMLRSLGIPSRLAVGFAVDQEDYDAQAGSYVIRDDNSYAWPEVYFPGAGWVQFNPTPDRPADLRPTERTALTGEDDLDFLKDLLANAPVSSSEGAFIPPDGISGEFPSSGNSGGFLTTTGGSNYTPWATLTVLAFIGLVVGAVMMGWQRSVAGLPYPQQLWDKTVRLASWGGLPPAPGQTPHDFADALRRSHYQLRDAVPLAAAYTRSRFGHKDIPEEELEELREKWPEMRRALLRGVAGRLFRRGRRSRGY